MTAQSRPEALDELCREALHRFSLNAFDNIDTDSFLAEELVTAERAEWIARHLLQHGRSLQAFKTGQQILQLLRSDNVA